MLALFSTVKTLILDWRLLAWRTRFQSTPWAPFLLFLLLGFLLANALIFWFVTTTYIRLLKLHSLDPETFITPILALAILWAFSATRIRYKHELANFWIIQTAPIPKWLRNLDRALSFYATLIAIGGPPLFIALSLAGYPLHVAANLLLMTGVIGLALWPLKLPDYLMDIAIGYTVGWVNGYATKVILENGVELVIATGPERLDRLWQLLSPYIVPLPKPLAITFCASTFMQTLVTFTLLFATFVVLSYLPIENEVNTLGAKLWKWTARFTGVHALLLEHLFSESEASIRRASGWVGFVLGLHHYLGWSVPPHSMLWVLGLLIWSPTLTKEIPLAAALTSNATVVELSELRIRLFRAKLEWVAITLFPLLLWRTPMPGFIGLLTFLSILWLNAKTLTRLPPILRGMLLLVGGVLVLWLFA